MIGWHAESSPANTGTDAQITALSNPDNGGHAAAKAEVGLGGQSQAGPVYRETRPESWFCLTAWHNGDEARTNGENSMSEVGKWRIDWFGPDESFEVTYWVTNRCYIHVRFDTEYEQQNPIEIWVMREKTIVEWPWKDHDPGPDEVIAKIRELAAGLGTK